MWIQLLYVDQFPIILYDEDPTGSGPTSSFWGDPAPALTLYGRTTAEPPLIPTMGTAVWVEMKSKICATASEPTLSSNTTPWTRLVDRVSQMRVSSARGLVLLTSTVMGFTSRGRSMKFSRLNRPLISVWYADPLNTTATFTEGVGIPKGRPEQKGTVQNSSSSSSSGGGHHGESLKQPRRTPISVTYCLEEGSEWGRGQQRDWNVRYTGTVAVFFWNVVIIRSNPCWLGNQTAFCLELAYFD